MTPAATALNSPATIKTDCQQHGHARCTRVRVAEQKVSSHPADDRVQQEQKQPMSAKGTKRVYSHITPLMARIQPKTRIESVAAL
jgi:hypothetical protein